jgi:hypothetical protein
MATMDKKGEIKEFTDQVRVICVKNGLDKPTLGKKIGLDNDKFFKAIKNHSFKPDPETYFKLEKVICGKDEHYRNKLRSKYEKTLERDEWAKYMSTSAVIFANPKNEKEQTDKVLQKEEQQAKVKPSETIDKESRIEFYNLAKSNLPEGTSVTSIDIALGHKYFSHMKDGLSYIPVEFMKDFFNICGFKKGSDIYERLVELELSCIAGRKETSQLEKYEKIFGEKGEKAEEENMAVVTTVNNKEADRKRFSDILTKWLFMKGYTLKQAARAIGCSELEFKNVINGDICLSPYHVNRFKDTLGMDEDTIRELISLANSAYEGHEIPEKILSYISSDITIINTLEEIIRQNKDVRFWDDVWKML